MLKTVLTTFLCTLLCSSPLFGSSKTSRFDQADALYKQRHIEAKAREALERYRAEYKKTPNDAEAGWRVAMACYFVGIRLTKDKEEQQKLWAEGRDAGKASVKATETDPNPSPPAPKSTQCSPCHFWTAINMALYGQSVGVFKMFFSLAAIREHLDKSIAIDPAYAYGGAYRLQGLIEQKLPGILGGDNDEAKAFFEKAIQAAPDEPLNYLFLARLLHEEFDDAEKALEVAKRGLATPEPSAERLEAIDARKELQALINERAASG